MKNILFGLFLVISAPVFAQLTVNEQFQKLGTVEQAQKWVEANQSLKPTIFKLSYGKDTAVIDKRLLRQKKGDVFHVGYTTYKILEAEEMIQYRAHYIFLDASSLTVKEIDSLKKIIVDKAEKGESFEKLSDTYTMDGNNTHGDTGWFFGEEMMPKEFQDAVSKHKKDEIFFIDVPEKQWSYIVKKSFDDQIKKDFTVIKSNGR